MYDKKKKLLYRITCFWIVIKPLSRPLLDDIIQYFTCMLYYWFVVFVNGDEYSNMSWDASTQLCTDGRGTLTSLFKIRTAPKTCYLVIGFWSFEFIRLTMFVSSVPKRGKGSWEKFSIFRLLFTSNLEDKLIIYIMLKIKGNHLKISLVYIVNSPIFSIIVPMQKINGTVKRSRCAIWQHIFRPL